MKAYIDTRNHRLSLHPESERDQFIAKQLAEKYQLIGCGRKTEKQGDRVVVTDLWSHVELRLEPK